MQTERADSMHKLQADKGISGHLFSGIVEQDRTASIPHSNLTKTKTKNTLMLLINSHDWHPLVGIENWSKAFPSQTVFSGCPLN